MTYRLHYIVVIFLLICHQYLLDAQPEVAEDFSVQWVTRDFNQPVGMLFNEDGTMYVWEKQGKVWTYQNGKKSSSPIIDLSEEVANYGDLGLMGFTLDPDYSNNGYCYLYYAVDHHHLFHYGKASYNANKNNYERAMIGRLIRITINFENGKADESSRIVLIGDRPDNGVPILHNSHMGGSIVFGDDGTLLLSTGDGSTWEGEYAGSGPPYFNARVEEALADGIIRPEEEVGAMRAQMINSYNGKILRIDPQSGSGLPSNPFYDEQSPFSVASKVWALGLRNPYRMTLRKGTGSDNPADGIPGTLFVGDVGASKWEELNIIIKKGQNFGWPLYEGKSRSEFYNIDQTNKDVINDCNGEPILFRELIKQPGNEVIFYNPCDPSELLDEDITFIHRPPDLALAHKTVGLGVHTIIYDENGHPQNIGIEDERSTVNGDVGKIRNNAVLAGPVYQGDKFPKEYKNNLFLADYNNGWITRATIDINDEVTGIYKFYKDTFYIAHVEENPSDGCLYFIEYNRGIKKICYDVNVPPIVHTVMDKNYGPSPLLVNFNAEESYDPEGDSLTYFWDFGDGQISTDVNPDHQFVADGIISYEVLLRVTDKEGLSTEEKYLISINNTPPQVDIEGITEGEKYTVVANNLFSLRGNISDKESNLEELDIKWTMILHHNTHYHEEEYSNEKNPRFSVPPVGCGGELFYYRFKLEVTDPNGLTAEDNQIIYPDCEDIYGQLLSFLIKNEENNVICNWAVRNEIKMENYEVQRSGAEKDFVTIGSISPHNTSSLHQYSFIDTHPLNGPNYYRLKLTGTSGKESYSEERFMMFSHQNGIYLYPNPTNGEFNLFINNLLENATISIYSLDGYELFFQEFEGSGKNTFILNAGSLHSGIYLYKIHNGGSEISGRLVIVK